MQSRPGCLAILPGPYMIKLGLFHFHKSCDLAPDRGIDCLQKIADALLLALGDTEDHIGITLTGPLVCPECVIR